MKTVIEMLAEQLKAIHLQPERKAVEMRFAVEYSLRLLIACGGDYKAACEILNECHKQN